MEILLNKQRILGQLGSLEPTYWQAIATAVNVEIGFATAFN
jgi:hypothetical protein